VSTYLPSVAPRMATFLQRFTHEEAAGREVARVSLMPVTDQRETACEKTTWIAENNAP
jgi:hypothetical protein